MNIKEIDFNNSLKKLAYIKDFAVGLDPTGVLSSRHAKTVKDNRGAHQTAAIAGGITGGMVIGAGIPAVAAGLGSLAMKKVNPELAQQLGHVSKASIEALHPGKLVNYARSLKPAMEVGAEAKKLVGAGFGLKDSLTGKSNPLEAPGHIKTILGGGELVKKEKAVSEKYYKGRPVSEGALKAVTAVTTAGASLGGAGVGGATAGLQYRQAYQNQDKEKLNKHASTGGNMNFVEQIKQAAFIDELEKIAGNPTRAELNTFSTIRARNLEEAKDAAKFKITKKTLTPQEEMDARNKFRAKHIIPLKLDPTKRPFANIYYRKTVSQPGFQEGIDFPYNSPRRS